MNTYSTGGPTDSSIYRGDELIGFMLGPARAVYVADLLNRYAEPVPPASPWPNHVVGERVDRPEDEPVGARLVSEYGVVVIRTRATNSCAWLGLTGPTSWPSHAEVRGWWRLRDVDEP